MMNPFWTGIVVCNVRYIALIVMQWSILYHFLLCSFDYWLTMAWSEGNIKGTSAVGVLHYEFQINVLSTCVVFDERQRTHPDIVLSAIFISRPPRPFQFSSNFTLNCPYHPWNVLFPIFSLRQTLRRLCSSHSLGVSLPVSLSGSIRGGRITITPIYLRDN